MSDSGTCILSLSNAYVQVIRLVFPIGELSSECRMESEVVDEARTATSIIRKMDMS